jgi:hypothetical protein
MKIFKKWGEWTDLSIGNYSATFYLLQARRRSDGKVQFRVASSTSAFNCPMIQLTHLSTVKA